jgi:signal peptidase II
MKSNPLYRAIIILLILAATVGLDQISKSIVRKKIADFQVVNVIKNKLVLEKVENTGAFLSLGDSVSGPVRIIFLNAIPLILVLLALGYIFIKPVNTTSLIAIIFMVGGGLGNLYDRIAHGSVTDFIYIDLGGFLHTGVFNVADMFITTGISMILIQSWFKKKPERVSEETDMQMDELETGHNHTAAEPNAES